MVGARFGPILSRVVTEVKCWDKFQLTVIFFLSCSAENDCDGYNLIASLIETSGATSCSWPTAPPSVCSRATAQGKDGSPCLVAAKPGPQANDVNHVFYWPWHQWSLNHFLNSTKHILGQINFKNSTLNGMWKETSWFQYSCAKTVNVLQVYSVPYSSHMEILQKRLQM